MHRVAYLATINSSLFPDTTPFYKLNAYRAYNKYLNQEIFKLDEVILQAH